MARPRPQPKPSPVKPECRSTSWRRSRQPKGEYLAATVQKKGRAASEILAESLPKEIAGIYWAKNMYWRGQVGREICPPGALDGCAARWRSCAGRVRRHSRGQTSAKVIAYCRLAPSRSARPSDYADKLSQAAVVPSSAAREERIRKALDAATRTIPGARWREDKPLLDTVVNLTEFPSVDSGQLRSGVSLASRRSAGHGNARSPEIFRAGRCRAASCCRIFSPC